MGHCLQYLQPSAHCVHQVHFFLSSDLNCLVLGAFRGALQARLDSSALALENWTAYWVSSRMTQLNLLFLGGSKIIHREFMVRGSGVGASPLQKPT